MNKIIESGSWGEGINWNLYSSVKEPEPSLCTAVFCVAIHNNKIVLTRSERGWGMLGGHVEDGESLLQALQRESQEEGGFTPCNSKVFGYREITSAKPIYNSARNQHYPFPRGYIVYYYSETDSKLCQPTGFEVLESSMFSLDEIYKMDIPDLSTIKLGWDTFHSSF